jgi:hypothetical protein
MKSRAIFGFLLTLFFLPYVFSQKYDNVWLMGYDASFAPDDSFCVSVFDFSTGNLQVGVNQDMEVFFQETNVSLCDSEGNLKMYSNGVHIFNRNHQIMENGANLMDGGALQSNSLPQGVLAFYMPGNGNQAVLIHAIDEYVQAPLWTVAVTGLYYSIVDLSANAGEGKVIQKKIPLLIDTLDYGKLTATRHGNGRDWWILVNEVNSNRFYKILLNDLGIIVYNNQAIGENVLETLGQAVFSPDGKIYAIAGSYNEVVGKFLSVYNFDRCSGELSNPQQLNWHDQIYGPTVGIAISPNSRYLYTSSNRYIYQYDLLASNIETSRQIVAIYDGFQSPFGSKFYLAQLGPDNKIYINCSNSENVMHVIHNPDELGLACNVEQHGIQLPCYNAYSIPNFPNYRLGDWHGSPCDSLGINPSVEPFGKIADFNIYPNPANISALITFNAPVTKDCRVILYDLASRVVLSEAVVEGSEAHKLSLDNLLNGWYFVCILENGEIVAREKLVVLRY